MSYKKPRPTKHSIRVGRGIAGLGLFAETEIKKGDFIIEYWGDILDDDTAEEKGGKYLFVIDKNWTIDGTTRKNIARYINHSCRPNSEPEIDGKRIFVYATKTIKPGQEITYHYGKDYFDGFITTKHCKCEKHSKR